MVVRITPDGVEDDGRREPEEVMEFIGSVSEHLTGLLAQIAHEDQFSPRDFQTVIEATYTYCKVQKGEV